MASPAAATLAPAPAQIVNIEYSEILEADDLLARERLGELAEEVIDGGDASGVDVIEGAQGFRELRVDLVDPGEEALCAELGLDGHHRGDHRERVADERAHRHLVLQFLGSEQPMQRVGDDHVGIGAAREGNRDLAELGDQGAGAIRAGCAGEEVIGEAAVHRA